MARKHDYLTPFSMGCSTIVVVLLFVLAMTIWMRLTKDWGKPRQESPYISNRTSEDGLKTRISFWEKHKDDKETLVKGIEEENIWANYVMT